MVTLGAISTEDRRRAGERALSEDLRDPLHLREPGRRFSTFRACRQVFVSALVLPARGKCLVDRVRGPLARSGGQDHRGGTGDRVPAREDEGLRCSPGLLMRPNYPNASLCSCNTVRQLRAVPPAPIALGLARMAAASFERPIPSGRYR